MREGACHHAAATGVPTAQRVATPKAQQQLARSWNTATQSLVTSARPAAHLGWWLRRAAVAVATGHAHSACVCIQLEPEVACGVTCCAEGWLQSMSAPTRYSNLLQHARAYIPGSLIPAAAGADAWPMPSSCCVARWLKHLSRHNGLNCCTVLGQLGHLKPASATCIHVKCMGICYRACRCIITVRTPLSRNWADQLSGKRGGTGKGNGKGDMPRGVKKRKPFQEGSLPRWRRHPDE